jgi:iron complex outermembrane receptor protein
MRRDDHAHLLPNLAIDQMNLEGSKPVFGLNALGGALNIQLENGFTYQGGDLDLHGGSFGTFGGDFQFGKQSDNTAVYVTVRRRQLFWGKR